MAEDEDRSAAATKRPTDLLLRWFYAGLAVGTCVGFVLFGWLRVVDPPKNREVPVAFCALVGAVVGLFAGIIHKVVKRR